MPSDKPRKKISKVSAGSTDDRTQQPANKGAGLGTQQPSGVEDSNSLGQTVDKSSKASQSPKKTNTVSLIGKQLGDFKILRKLGQGGMATVYLAEQVSLKREAAIKVMHDELLSDETHLKRFEREAKAAAGLTHPNIVQVYMTGDFEGTHYIAQEYVRGINLKEHLTRYAPPDISLILRIMRQVAAALNAASEKEIVHRDIKPENIMITTKKMIKVADFGLAQIAQSDERVNLTQVGVTMGTPLYMSPEQVNGKSLDQRSDIYSLGVTCYHLISGRPPFLGETALSIAVKHLNEPPPPLKDRRPDLPEALCDLVHRMMEKNPDDRPADPTELMQEIKKIPAQASDSQQQSWRSLVSFQGNHLLQKQLATFLLVALCVGSVSAAVGWFSRPRDPLNAPFVQNTGDNSSSTNIVPDQKSAMKQFFFAVKNERSEDAWKAVIDYYPDDVLFKRRAQIRLGLLLCKPDRYAEANTIFQELADSDQLSYQTNGYAGLMVLESLKENFLESQKIWELRVKNQDFDSEMKENVAEALRRNQSHPEIENSQALKNLNGSISTSTDRPPFN